MRTAPRFDRVRFSLAFLFAALIASCAQADLLSSLGLKAFHSSNSNRSQDNRGTRGNSGAANAETEATSGEQAAFAKNEAGIRAFDDGDFETALNLFEEAGALSPSDDAIQHNIKIAKSELAAQKTHSAASAANRQGVTAAKLGDDETALKMYREAARQWPDNAVFQNNIAKAEGRLKAAEERRAAELVRRAARDLGKSSSGRTDQLRLRPTSNSGDDLQFVPVGGANTIGPTSALEQAPRADRESTQTAKGQLQGPNENQLNGFERSRDRWNGAKLPVFVQSSVNLDQIREGTLKKILAQKPEFAEKLEARKKLLANAQDLNQQMRRIEEERAKPGADPNLAVKQEELKQLQSQNEYNTLILEKQMRKVVESYSVEVP